MAAAAPVAVAGCPLCDADGGTLVVRTPRWRLIRADEEGFPAFYRVVWNAHVAEFSQLGAAERAECMEAVAEVEGALLRQLQPAKVNLAALGNMVPHLHWHVIARFGWDSRYPSPVWAPQARPVDAARVAEIAALLPALEAGLAARFRHTA
ncbi:HIT family protein [Ramlibacter sp.]|uniref:HIT family protein n=1 Tax=Ramlibacter sp. TaxID=1917967 RepID=UPI0018380296|nr:HIT family protein [Ramlibacter sp.]MBA2672067.1 HIT family protein [Ramlibacter sp.]